MLIMQFVPIQETMAFIKVHDKYNDIMIFSAKLTIVTKIQTCIAYSFHNCNNTFHMLTTHNHHS